MYFAFFCARILANGFELASINSTTQLEDFLSGFFFFTDRTQFWFLLFFDVHNINIELCGVIHLATHSGFHFTQSLLLFNVHVVDGIPLNIRHIQYPKRVVCIADSL